jgi:hypothetical protein
VAKVRRLTITLIMALAATILVGCGSNSPSTSTSAEVTHVKQVSDKTPAKKQAQQFITTAPKSKKYPFKIISVNNPSVPGAVTITVTNVSNQPAGPLIVQFGGSYNGTGVQPSPNIETSDHQKLADGFKSTTSKAFGVKVLEPNASYTVKAFYQEGTCVQANARLLKQPELTPFHDVSSCG